METRQMDRMFSLGGDECPVCFNEIEEHNRSTLECGHTTCTECFVKSTAVGMQTCCQCRAPAKRRRVTVTHPAITDHIQVTIGKAGTNRFISVLAPIKEEEEPISYALAFDTSESMKTLMPCVIEVGVKLVQSMRNGDTLILVSYNHNIEKAMGPMEISPTTLAEAVSFIRGMRAYGGTDIALAVKTVMDLMPDTPHPKMVATMTDGSDLTSPAEWNEIAASAHTQNIILSLVGIGPDVSLSMCSCKHFACVLNPDALEEVMDNWMQTAQLLYAQNLTLKIKTDPGSRIMFTGNTEGIVVPTDGVLSVPIDNLYCKTPFHIGIAGDINTITAMFTNKEGKIFSSSDVNYTTEYEGLQIELITLKALKEALKLASQHLYVEAQAVISKAKSATNAINATLAEPHIKSLDDVVCNMRDEDSYDKTGRGIQV